jgi:hypothetical protein
MQLDFYLIIEITNDYDLQEWQFKVYVIYYKFVQL